MSSVLAGLAALLLLPASARALDAAAAKVDITPDLRTEKVFLAGYGPKGRRPEGVHDPLYARLLLLREGDRLVAIASFDLLGLYRNDVEDLRRLSGFDSEKRRLFVHATHTHSGPDTLGLWGPFFGVSGVHKRYHARLKRETAERLGALEKELRPATLEAGRGRLDPRGLCRDSRDPQVIDPNLAVLKVRSGGRTLATAVNWSCHPEVLGPDNLLVTADFPGPLCARIAEKGGGECLFLNGMIGGLMTPDNNGDVFPESERIGRAVADAALALKTARGPSRPLKMSAKTVRVPIENSRYLLVLPALVFGHHLHDKEGRRLPSWKAWTLSLRHMLTPGGLPEDARPWIESEVSLVDAGPARLLGLPAEVFPELAIGGYGGEWSFGRPVLTPANPDPPALKAAPKGPYLRDTVKAPAPMLVGLANDELGYVMPTYDFKTSGTKTLSPRPKGHHYEETNSIGPSAAAVLAEAAAALLRENP